MKDQNIKQTDEKNLEQEPLNKKTLNILIAGTLLGFSLISWVIAQFILGIPMFSLFKSELSIGLQLVFGLLIGSILSAVNMFCLFRYSFLKSLRRFSNELYSMIKPDLHQIILISIAAGWGEELFFRGILQPYLGIFLSSIIFTILHTGIKLKKSTQVCYMISVYALSLGLGIIYVKIGLAASMIAHAAWDIVVLCSFKYWDK